MLSRTADYAIRAAVMLGRHHGDRLVSADEIASTVGAPRNYMSKILNVLVRHGILSSARGPGGGFALALPPHKLFIADLVDVFEETRAIATRCLLADAPCDRRNPCSAHQRWTELTLHSRTSMLNTAISELCGGSTTRMTTAPQGAPRSPTLDAGQHSSPGTEP